MKLEIDTTQSIEDIIKQVEEAKAKQELRRWRAKKHSEYYLVCSKNKVEHSIDVRHRYDNIRYELGNYFKTEEEASQEARLRDFEQRVAARLQDLNGGEKYKFKPDVKNYTFYIDLYDKTVHIQSSFFSFCSQRGWWAPKPGHIKQVIKEFGEENFIKWARGDL